MSKSFSSLNISNMKLLNACYGRDTNTDRSYIHSVNISTFLYTLESILSFSLQVRRRVPASSVVPKQQCTYSFAGSLSKYSRTSNTLPPPHYSTLRLTCLAIFIQGKKKWPKLWHHVVATRHGVLRFNGKGDHKRSFFPSCLCSCFCLFLKDGTLHINESC